MRNFIGMKFRFKNSMKSAPTPHGNSAERRKLRKVNIGGLIPIVAPASCLCEGTHGQDARAAAVQGPNVRPTANAEAPYEPCSSGRESAPSEFKRKSEPTHIGCYGSGGQSVRIVVLEKSKPVIPGVWSLQFLLLLSALFLCLNLRATEIPKLTPAGFAIPQPGRHFVFPRDYGSHPAFAIEWWYVTGHLIATSHQHFGFQATFFRRALMPPGDTNRSSSTAFGNDQLYLAHAALTDIAHDAFHYQERLNRDGWDAFAATNTLNVRNGNWTLRLLPKETGASVSNAFALQFTVGANIALELDLTPETPLVIFGTNGVSRKAADPSAASHYLTFPRLTASGTLSLGATNLPVTGEAWMDHEFSSSQLGTNQVGWDWLSLQLFDHRELMGYRMRRADGSTDPFSTVAWIDPQGKVRQIGPSQFRWTVLKHWHSSKTGANYPSLVQLKATNPETGHEETFLIQPLVANQELADQSGGLAYWEGACRVLNANRNPIGQAYMELTGYSQSLKGKF